MTSLSTEYLGLRLDCPLIAASSPLSRDVADIRRLEDAGAGAVVLFSLFQEQLGGDRWQRVEASGFVMAPARYLEHIAAAKAAVAIPIIASLNVSRLDSWLAQASLMQQAGADAIELDIYTVPSDPTLTGEHVEAAYLETLSAVKSEVDIPVAVKLCPFFTSMPAFAQRLDDAGVDALVLFNRLYQPSIDIERREMVVRADLSRPNDSHVAIQWIAILSGQLRAGLAATGGMHSAEDVIRALMAGAEVVAMCSALLAHGIGHLDLVRGELERWLEAHELDSLDDIRGVMSLSHYSRPEEFKRAGYAKVLGRYW